MRYADSAIFSQLPPSGVNSGMLPCCTNHWHSRQFLCPERRVAHQPHPQGWQRHDDVRPTPGVPRAERAAITWGSGGSLAKIWSTCAFLPGMQYRIGAETTPLARTWPGVG